MPGITAKISRVVNLSIAAVEGIGGNPGFVRPPSDRVVPLITVGTSSLCREADEVPQRRHLNPTCAQGSVLGTATPVTG